MSDWQSLVVQVPGKDLLEPVREVMETLLIFLEVLKTILDTVKVFLVDFGNPLKILVETLISLIEELFLSLKVSGAFGLFHVPNPLEDPNFNNHAGHNAFTDVFKASLFDSKDPNRPQPRPGSTQGGFLLLMVTSDSPYGLLARVKQLLRFFSREFTSPRYEAPQSLKVAPLGPDGDPILSVADIFATSTSEVGLTWDLPTSMETPDPGFSDLVSRVAQEVIPAKYLIEKSTINPSNDKIDITDLSDKTKAGLVEHDVSRQIAGTTIPVTQRALVKDDNNEPIVKFTEYIVLDEGVVDSLIGSLGKMRWVDKDVVPDGQYFYRVRAFSGDLLITPEKQIDWGFLVYSDREFRLRWPTGSDDPEEVCIMGKATGIVSVRVPNPPIDGITGATFDVVEELKRVFQAAFTVEFHINLRGPSDFPGVSSLTRQAGTAAAYQPEELIRQINRAPGASLLERIAFLETTTVLEFPWESRSVRRQAARLADTVASAMLASGSSVLEQFRSLMQSTNSIQALGADTLEEAVFLLTSTDTSQDEKSNNFLSVYADDEFREALLEVTEFIKSFTLGGTAPDWAAVSPLRDIIPWSGEVIYVLLDKIQALVDAFAGVASEIQGFIDLLTRKIETLERTLQFLISILDFIESLQIGAYVLSVPGFTGTAHDWARAVDQAGGTRPSGPGGYSAGVALGYVAPDVTALKTAFSVIFG